MIQLARLKSNFRKSKPLNSVIRSSILLVISYKFYHYDSCYVKLVHYHSAIRENWNNFYKFSSQEATRLTWKSQTPSLSMINLSTGFCCLQDWCWLRSYPSDFLHLGKTIIDLRYFCFFVSKCFSMPTTLSPSIFFYLLKSYLF